MRFIRWHALVHLLSPVDASSDGPHIYLALVSADLLGVGWRCGSSSHTFYALPMARLASAHWVCFVLKFVLCTPWTFGKTWGLRSILEVSPFDFWCPTFSGGGSEVAGKFSFTVHSAQAAEVFPYAWSTNHRGGLHSCLRVNFSLRSRLAGFLGILHVLKGSMFFWGLRNSQRDCSTPVSNVPGSLIPPFLFFSFSDEEGISGSIIWSLAGLIWWPSFLFML